MDGLERENLLLRRLLALGTQRDFETLVRDALGLIVEHAQVRRGYLELREGEGAGALVWSMSHGFEPEQLANVRAYLSGRIISEAMATGAPVVTQSALLDDRFGMQESVLKQQIEAVLCVPIGEAPPRGVLYLEGRSRPGLFGEGELSLAVVFAAQLALVADRLLAERKILRLDDPTRDLRSRLDLEGFICRSPAWADILSEVAVTARQDVNVLLTGESGVGKTELARVIHRNSNRASGPYVEVNCATLPENLVESELFGAQRGAHSTASERILGKVHAAQGGTFVLDEITELPLSAQAKLLQLIQSRTFYSLGSSQAEQADVRLIAITNADLTAAVRERRFREDLYYRLSVVSLHVPNLAERREDLRELARRLCAVALERHRLPSGLRLSAGALSAIEYADWPGNARQLGNAIEIAALRAAGNGELEIGAQRIFPRTTVDESSESPTLQAATQRFQARHIREVLDECQWNVAAAAVRLDIARSHLYTLIRGFKLRRGDA